MQNSSGLIALLGSGKTSLPGGRVFESIAGRISRPVRKAVLETPAGFELNSPVDMDLPAEVSRLAEARLQARNCQDWAEADTLRLQMAALGWIAQDTPEGQRLVRQS